MTLGCVSAVTLNCILKLGAFHLLRGGGPVITGNRFVAICDLLINSQIDTTAFHSGYAGRLGSKLNQPKPMLQASHLPDGEAIRIAVRLRIFLSPPQICFVLASDKSTCETTAGTNKMSIDDEANCLRKIPVFECLEANRIRLLAFASDLVEYPAGKTIMQQGDYGDAIYVIIDGTVEIEITDADEKTITKEFGKHTIFGELSVMKGTLRAAAVASKTDIVALKISKKVLEDMMEDQPQLRLALVEYIDNAGYGDF